MQFLVYVLIAGVIGLVVGWAIWARDSRRVRAIHNTTLAAMQRATDREVSAITIASRGGAKPNDAIVLNALPVVGSDIADASVVYVVDDQAEADSTLPITKEEVEAIVEAEAIAEAEDLVLVEEIEIIDVREIDVDETNELIEEAGTKMAEALRAAGITSFAELGAANKADIAAALSASQSSPGDAKKETKQSKAKDGTSNKHKDSGKKK